MKFGRTYEPVARRFYQDRIQKIVYYLWLNRADKQQDHITYRGKQIKLNANKDFPVVQVLDTTGSLVHSKYHYVRGSPDGIVTINGVVVGLIEIKSSMFGVYRISKKQHHDQVCYFASLNKQPLMYVYRFSS